MRRALVVLVCLIVAGGVGWLVWQRTTPPPGASRNGTPPVPVLVAKAARRNVPVYLDALGTVQAFNTVTVRSMIDGPLLEVDFKEGQDVHAGDVLARIDPRPYQATLDQYVAKKAQDEATLANAKLDLARYQKLIVNNYTSAQIADTQKATVAEDEAIVRQDQANIDSARTQLSYTTITAPLDGRTGIRQVDAGNIIHSSDTNGLVVITQLQPISVLFTLPQQTLPQVAAAMQAGSPLVLALPQGALDAGAEDEDSTVGPGLAEAQTASVAADPPADAAPAASDPPAPAHAAADPPAAGAQAADPPAADPPGGASAAAAARPGAGTAAATPRVSVLDRGQLTVLDNQVDSTTGTIKLKATFPNAGLRLWPGGFVNVRLRVQVLHDAVTVPPVAVQSGPRGSYVYVIGDDKTAQRRPVTVGHEDEQVSVITAGLEVGDTVVVDGASRLNNGSKVSIAQPVAAATGPEPAATPHHHRHGGQGAAPQTDAPQTDAPKTDAPKAGG